MVFGTYPVLLIDNARLSPVDDTHSPGSPSSQAYPHARLRCQVGLLVPPKHPPAHHLQVQVSAGLVVGVHINVSALPLMSSMCLMRKLMFSTARHALRFRPSI